MTPEQIEEQVLSYVLGDLNGADASTFEAMLLRSPELQTRVRECTATLAAVAHKAGGNQRPSEQVWAGIEASIRGRARLAAAAPERRPHADFEAVAPREQSGVGRAAFWTWAAAAAAAVFMLLNLGQWWYWSRDAAHREENLAADTRDRPDGEEPQAPTGPDDPRGPVEGPSGSESAGAGILNTVVQLPDGPKLTVAELLNQHQDLQQRYQQLNTDYEQLTDRVLPLLVAASRSLDPADPGEDDGGDTRPGSGRIWVMQLGSGPDGNPALIAGLWERASILAPEQGVAVLPDTWHLSNGLTIDPNQLRRFLEAAAQPPDPSASGIPGVTRVEDLTSLTETASASPYATALLNADEGLGYLDLYNLPSIGGEQQMALWMRPVDDGPYQLIGTVPPEIAGGSGGLVFRVPVSESDSPPRNIVITVEPSGDLAQPSGPVVIQTP